MTKKIGVKVGRKCISGGGRGGRASDREAVVLVVD
jgi:hypothetical protein